MFKRFIYYMAMLYLIAVSIVYGHGHELELTTTLRGPLIARQISSELVALSRSHLSRNVLTANVDEQITGDLFQINTKVLVGNRTFIVQVDTGSSLMAIPLVGCSTCENRPVYNPAESSTSSVIPCSSDKCLGSGSSPPSCKVRSANGNCDFQILYGDGSRVSGIVYEDVVSLSGLTATANFGANQIETGDFEYPRADGILGLGRSCHKCVPTIFDSIVQSTGIKDLFAMLLDYNGSGTLSLGEINPAYYQGDIQYTPYATDSPFYAIKPTAFKVDETQINPRLMGSNVIVDSGSTALSLASGSYDALVHHFKTNYCHVQGVCDHPNIFDGTICYNSPDVISKFPTLYLTFDGGVQIAIPPKNYLIKALLSNGKNGYCWMIDRSDAYTTILGDVFMRGLYTIFDNEQKRVGFAMGRGIDSDNTALNTPTNDNHNIDNNNYEDDGNNYF